MPKLVQDVADVKLVENTERRFELWNTWLVLLVGLGLMVTEWFLRKVQNLR